MRVLEVVQHMKNTPVGEECADYSRGALIGTIERMSATEFQVFAAELDKLVAGAEYIAKMSTGHLCVMDDDAGNLFKVTRMHLLYPTLSDEQREMMAEMLSTEK